MLYQGRMSCWKLCTVWKRLIYHNKSAFIVLISVFSVLLIVYTFSNVGDIIYYYLSSGSKPLPLSIHCNAGRLGNQMCTYASLYGLGALNKDRSIVAPYCNLKHLKSIFEHLSLPQAPLLYIPINTSNLLSYLKLEDRNIPATSNFIDGFRYPCSYTFFDHAQDEIRREFQFSEDLQRHARKVLSKANVNSLKNPTYVAIHVRRGDYQKRWLDIFKGVAVNKEYFQKALEYFRNKYQRLVFVVVSDDRLWCINHLSGILGVYVTEEAPTPMHDLAVMAHCNHTIMTYGTFGFWGAYLAGGDVVYFDKFLEPNTSFTKNNFIFDKMYPPRWKGIVTTNITKLKYS